MSAATASQSPRHEERSRVMLTAAFMLVRSRPIAIVAACILWTLSDLFSHTSSSSAFHGETSLIVLLVSALSVGILASIFLKRGLLPFVTFFYVTRILEQPVTTETERYYHAYGVLALVAVGLIGYYGYFGCKSPGPDRRRSEFA